MTHHEIRDGEGLSMLAERHGLAPDTVWLHPENRALRALRADGNTLHPGDVLFIPPKTPRTVDCEVDATHRFVRRGVPAVLRLKLLRNGRPRAGEACVLEADGLRREARADADGRIDFPVPPSLAQARLTVGDDPPRLLQVGTLRTLSADAGVQRRLANLGLYDGPCDGPATPARRARIFVLARSFQCSRKSLNALRHRCAERTIAPKLGSGSWRSTAGSLRVAKPTLLFR